MTPKWKKRLVEIAFGIVLAYWIAAYITFTIRYPMSRRGDYRVYLVEVLSFQRVPELEGKGP